MAAPVVVIGATWRSTEHAGFALMLGFFPPIKNHYAELTCERVRGRNDNRYEHFDISPDTIEQELRSLDCEQRPTELRRIII